MTVLEDMTKSFSCALATLMGYGMSYGTISDKYTQRVVSISLDPECSEADRWARYIMPAAEAMANMLKRDKANAFLAVLCNPTENETASNSGYISVYGRREMVDGQEWIKWDVCGAKSGK